MISKKPSLQLRKNCGTSGIAKKNSQILAIFKLLINIYESMPLIEYVIQSFLKLDTIWADNEYSTPINY